MFEHGAFEPDLCYGCGKRYLTRVNSFSPLWKCSECGAPLCVLCWETGERRCARHSGNAMESTGPAQSAAPETPAVPPPASESAPSGARPRMAEIFLRGFERNIRSCREVVIPWSGETLRLDPDARVQTPERLFGEVRQFSFSSGLLKRNRLCLAAIALHDPPPARVLELVSGPMGLSFQDDAAYCIGIFSPAGWRDSMETLDPVRGNACVYLVEHLAGTAWSVAGPEAPWKSLFDPETFPEQETRAGTALSAAPDLRFPGGFVFLDGFLEQNHLTREAVERAADSSNGRYLIIEHKGRYAIQRTSQ